MKTALTTIAIILFAGAALAQTDIFPPQVAGDYAFRAQSAPEQLDANGVPLVPSTASVGAVLASAPDAVISCVDMGPDEIAPIVVRLTPSGDRAEVRGRAFEARGCVGLKSSLSANAAFMFFVGPTEPDLVE